MTIRASTELAPAKGLVAARPQSPEDLLTVAQLAEIIGCSHQAIYNLRHNGTGPASFRLAGKVRYRRSAVDAWIAAAEAAEATRADFKP